MTTIQTPESLDARKDNKLLRNETLRERFKKTPNNKNIRLAKNQFQVVNEPFELLPLESMTQVQRDEKDERCGQETAPELSKIQIKTILTAVYFNCHR